MSYIRVSTAQSIGMLESFVNDKIQNEEMKNDAVLKSIQVECKLSKTNSLWFAIMVFNE